MENSLLMPSIIHSLFVLFLGNNGYSILLSNSTIGDIKVIREKIWKPKANTAHYNGIFSPLSSHQEYLSCWAKFSFILFSPMFCDNISVTIHQDFCREKLAKYCCNILFTCELYLPADHCALVCSLETLSQSWLWVFQRWYNVPRTNAILASHFNGKCQDLQS